MLIDGAHLERANQRQWGDLDRQAQLKKCFFVLETSAAAWKRFHTSQHNKHTNTYHFDTLG
jgi:hypothetical protein